MSKKLFTETKLGSLNLKNHLVMAPMTRSRAINNIPNELMATYYAQRAEAGLLITEGTSPSPNGLGYARIPGAYSAEQIAGWKLVTDAVHEKGGKIFLQIMHVGRVAHQANLPEGAEIVAPSAISAEGDMWTDTEQMQKTPVPREMTKEDIQQAVQEYVDAAKNAIEAGFDGVELHGANGYLLDQFINTASNQRTDEYGGSIENRSRFVLEVAQATVEAIGKEKVGMRLSPYGVFNNMAVYPELDDAYAYLAEELNKIDLVYLHLVNHSAMGAPEVPQGVVDRIRAAFKNTLILSGGYDAERAEQDLQSGAADLIAVGRPFISNPDLVTRFKEGIELAQPDQDTFYSPDEKGYTDYKTAAETVA